MNYHNDLILKAAKKIETHRPPVWMMRQAGRVLPQYLEVRKKAGNFINLVKTPELACEVTIQPIDYYGVDAAIIFSDILVIPEAMGLPYEMVESRGPNFPNTIETLADIEKLHIAENIDYSYMTEAVNLTASTLAKRVPLIGFAGAPFTILTYMVEGKGSKTFSKAKKWLFTENILSHKLLEKITQSTINYLSDQIKNGAAMIQLFDSWAGILSPTHYSEFSYQYNQIIASELKKKFPEIPLVIFAKGAYFARKEYANSSFDVIGLDWNMDIKESILQTGNQKVLQGNLDPCVLYGNEESIVNNTQMMLNDFDSSFFIANLGHGIYPDIEKEKAKLFVETVKDFRLKT